MAGAYLCHWLVPERIAYFYRFFSHRKPIPVPASESRLAYTPIPHNFKVTASQIEAYNDMYLKKYRVSFNKNFLKERGAKYLMTLASI